MSYSLDSETHLNICSEYLLHDESKEDHNDFSKPAPLSHINTSLVQKTSMVVGHETISLNQGGLSM